MSFLLPLGGLPVPVDIQPSDRVVVVRNGVAYIASMSDVKTEMDAGDVLSANNLSLALSAGASLFLHGWDGHYKKNTFGSVNLTSKA